MREARREVNAAMAEAKKQAPLFAGEVVLIRIHSSCQIHPLITQIWRCRLPKYVVMVANDGYRPGHVHFSVRGQQINVLDFLSSVHISDGAAHTVTDTIRPARRKLYRQPMECSLGSARVSRRAFSYRLNPALTCDIFLLSFQNNNQGQH